MAAGPGLEQQLSSLNPTRWVTEFFVNSHITSALRSTGHFHFQDCLCQSRETFPINSPLSCSSGLLILTWVLPYLLSRLDAEQHKAGDQGRRPGFGGHLLPELPSGLLAAAEADLRPRVRARCQETAAGKERKTIRHQQIHCKDDGGHRAV